MPSSPIGIAGAGQLYPSNNGLDLLANALVGFQGDMENVTKDAVNPFFKSKYATLEAIITAAKPHLKKHGLAVVQLPEGSGLTTMIIHASGQRITGHATIAIKDQTPQGQGSAITYMRRYALSAALGIATEDDDDGNEATKPTVKAPVAAKTDSPAKKTPDPVLTDKKRIMSLLKDLGEEQTAPNILFITGLSVEDPKNLSDIIARLEALADERNSAVQI